MYERRAVLFLDILGFKKLIDDHQEDLILSALEMPKELQEKYPFNGKTEMQISAFSDSIVISEVIQENHIGINRLVNYAGYVWWKFLAKGVLARGGIAVGDLYHKNGILFGPAMNEAYKLESELAIYPRIVLSHESQQCLFNELKEEYKENALMLAVTLDIMRRDFDGVTYIHTLGISGATPPEILPEKELDPVTQSRSYISTEINAAKWGAVDVFLNQGRPSELRAKAKHDWLENYLNMTRRGA